MNTPDQADFPHGGTAALDPHLDPDQLSAFLEGALPEPERLLVLRHMAACSDCREVVFLTQSADPALSAATVAEQVPRRWFPGPFGLLWTAGLACCLLGVLLFQFQARPRSQPRANIAVVRPAIETTPVPQATPSPEPVSTPPKAVAARTLGRHRIVPPAAVPPPAPPAASIELPSEYRALNPQTDQFLQSSPAPAAASTNRQAKALAQEAPPPGYRAGSAAAALPALRPAPAPGGESPSGLSQQPVPAKVDASAAAALAIPGIDIAASTVALPPAASAAPIASLPPSRSTETVEVSTSAVIVNASGVPLPQKTDPDPLPSGLSSITSIAAEPGFHLELDTAGHLYWSRKGKHWKLVPPSWPGAIQTLHRDEQGVLQLTTTTGALWTSNDGRHWRPAL